MCKVIRKNENKNLKDSMRNITKDDKEVKLLFWIMLITLIVLALRPSIMIIGSGNGNGSGSGDGNNVFRTEVDK